MRAGRHRAAQGKKERGGRKRDGPSGHCFPSRASSGYAVAVAGSLVVNEIYRSVQGESTFAGLPCVFVRLTGCALRCSYCDTAYAFTAGARRSFEDIREAVEQLAAPHAGQRILEHRLPLVEFTGGEPLLQIQAPALMREFCDAGFTVLVETGGAHDIGMLDPRIRRIMDLKTPSSGESARNRWENIAQLQPTDEVKFVIGTREDYEWARDVLLRHQLAGRCPLLFSWVAPLVPHQHDASLKPLPAGATPISRQELVEALLEDHLPVRFQLQMHKFIWPPDQKGV
ncbi:MAG: radical SAM protein [Verrucomicrobiae bacterium]|nr:radical SAM protein [Verrucomicrobiae bacterium]